MPLGDRMRHRPRLIRWGDEIDRDALAAGRAVLDTPDRAPDPGFEPDDGRLVGYLRDRRETDEEPPWPR